MSAIFGILRFDGVDVSARELERMGNTLAHRGPDGRKVVADGAIGLGHCLMRVNREDLFEAQPLRDRDADLTLVADCRIDNREELAGIFGIDAAELRDLPDSAFILRAYKKWGEDAAEHLLGDFAFAIWDGRAKKLVLVRDHMGQRYVHYHLANGFFVFGTEMNALWAVGDVPRVLDDDSIGRYLLRAWENPPGTTFFSGIYGLPAASACVVTPDRKLRLRRYWRPAPTAEHEDRDEEHYIRTYRAVLEEAVACRLRRLVHPAALSLSGGFDSAAIAGLAGPVLEAQGRKLITVSSVMPEGYEGPHRNPRRWVEACRRKMPHLDVRYYVRHGETALTGLSEWYNEVGRPPFDHHYVHTGMYKRAASSGVRLMIDGHGGDFSINPRGYQGPSLLLRRGRLGDFLREWRATARFTGRTMWQVFRRDVVPLLLPLAVRRMRDFARRGFVPLAKARFAPTEFVDELVRKGAVDPARLRGGLPRYDRPREDIFEILERISRLPAFHFDVPAARHQMDFARPFFDKRIVEFGLAVPEDLYFRNGKTRHLARRALADVYPPEILQRWGGNDPADPDYVGMYDSIIGSAISETDRLAQNASLRRYIDFQSLRDTLAAVQPGADRTAAQKLALRAVLAARFIEWTMQQNR
jgi:asparagine synthase (glutamine-hydrolysing)